MNLGWRVSSEFSPIYWHSRSARPGGQGPADLVRVGASELKHHTLVIAGSGAGKSYFLGRLLEELVLESKRSHVLVLDPNSDYRQLGDLRDAGDWRLRTDSGRQLHLMTESSRRDIAAKWANVQVKVKVGDVSLRRGYHRKEALPWLKVAPELIGEDLEPEYQHDVFHCHELLREIVDLCDLCDKNAGKAPAVLESVFRAAAHNVGGLGKAQDVLNNEFGKPRRRLKKSEESLRLRLIARAASRPRSIDQRVEHYYTSRLRRYQAGGLISYDSVWPKVRERIRVVDLASFDDASFMLMTVNAELGRIWSLARAAALDGSSTPGSKRPYFVVIDEAHNLVPAQTDSRSVATIRAEIRRVVAEGRKYGVFVVLASQRPEKLDDQVVSECQNLALMRLPSTQVAARLRQRLQFDDRLLPFEAAADFRKGLVAIYGRWAGDRPQVLESAGRRTMEGGLDLAPSLW